jgi:hypothetical protein
MSYLYEELPAEQRAGLGSHLNDCMACQSQLKIWQGATREMDHWRSRPRRPRRQVRFVRWAAAAAVLVFVTLGANRFVALNNEVRQLRAEVRRASSTDLNAAFAQVSEAAAKSASTETQALVAALAQRLEEQRMADQQATLTALQKLSARHTEDFAVMRKELETVAVFTEAGLQRTQNQLATLAFSPGTLSNNKQD